MPYRQSEKSERRKEIRRKQILKSAADVFTEKGYHQTSVKDIAGVANMSVGTFYLYFKCKEDVFDTLYDEMWRYILNLIEYAKKGGSYSPSQLLARGITANLWGYKRFEKLSKIMLIEAIGINPRYKAKYTSIMLESANMIKEGFYALKVDNQIDVNDLNVASIAYIGAVNNVITCWLLSEKDFDLNSSIFSLIVFLLQAIKMDFDGADIRHMIDDITNELNNNSAISEVF